LHASDQNVVKHHGTFLGDGGQSFPKLEVNVVRLSLQNQFVLEFQKVAAQRPSMASKNGLKW